MKLYLLRHISHQMPDDFVCGSSDPELSEKFPEELQSVRKILDFQFSRIYSSPLKRCSMLAEKLKADVPVHFDERLKEYDFGLWEGRAWSDIDREEINLWSKNLERNSPPGGESFYHFQKRIKDFTEEIHTDFATENLLLVTHAGVIRFFLSEVLRIPYEKSFSFSIDKGRLSMIEMDRNGNKIHFVNKG